MRILHAGVDPDLVMSTNSGGGRQPGVHLSDILKRMAYEKDKKYHPDNPIDMMMLECGFTWEEVLSHSLAARHKDRAGYRPEQIQEDGIWMSPDWIGPDGLEEWKATRKSSNRWEEKLQEWLPQGKSYLRALLKSRTVSQFTVTWRVWFMVGDWTFESKGDMTLLRDYHKIVVEFTKRELEENWWGIVAAGRRYGLLKEGKPWEEQPSQSSQSRKRSSRPPQPSQGKVRPITPRATKTLPKPPAA